jgi:tricorn protease
MKTVKLTLLILISFFSINNLIAQEDLAYFISNPSLSPDAQKIVFVYENDLWQVDINGGVANRLTGMDGAESNPHFSPDGKWIAFSSKQNGNSDIFLMPVNGGEIKQLTFHDANDFVESWSWDSQSIYFTSSRYNVMGSYKINISGNTPERLFGDNYFNNVHHIIESPTEEAFYFTESWESFMFPHRKRYKGDHNPNIKYYNSSTKEYKELTNYEGKDLWSTVDSHGNLYFASDEANTVYNLFSLKDGEKNQLTDFTSAIGRPQVSANGKKVVFTKDYQVFVYDIESKETVKPKINIVKNETLEINKSYKTQGKISNFDISPDNKKIAFVSRGRLFVSDIKGKFIKEIKTNNLERVLEVKWFADNKTILYTRTNKGWTNLFSVSASENNAEKQLTFEKKTERYIEVSPKRDKAVFISGSMYISLIDLKTLNVEKIVEDEFWFRGSQPMFSPDGKFIVYTAFRNFEPDVFVYDMKLKTSVNITNTGVRENSPVWSSDGKYLYISAERYLPGFPRGKGTPKIYRIPLYRFTKDFKSDEYDNLFAKESKKDSVIDIKFELDNISERWESVVKQAGQHYSPSIFKDKNKEILFFNTYTDDGKEAFYKSEIKAFEKIETKKLFDKSYDMITKAKNKYYALVKGDIYTVNTSGNKLEKIKIEFTFSKNLQDEFVQMFYENWAALAENFYDINYHGIDWTATKTQYETYLPYVRNRENLRTLQIDMLGELNGSHLDFRTSGDEQKTFYKTKSNETGIIFDNGNPYNVKHFLAKSPVDILANPIKPGDELIAVNNTLVDKTKNRNLYFNATEKKDEILLTFKRSNSNFDVKIHPVSSKALNGLLYDEWIATKQEIVDKASQKRIAYVYMKNMGSGNLNKFLIDMTTEAVHRDALILDLRYNRGGNVHDDVLQFLSQTPYMNWKYRNGKLSPQPNFAPSGKPIVLLINEHSLSDAEMTAEGFKQLKLGKIIGTETYRWIIFTSARGMVDGSYTRLPAWGCYTLDGKDLEMTGVAPDIYVKNTFMDRLNNTDPQLEKAIQEILKELK